MRLASLTAPLARLDDSVALVAIGSTEQHSNHLPAGTDTILVESIAQEVERRSGERLVLLPTVPYGASHHHEPLGSTVSIGSTVLADVITALVRSARRSLRVRIAVIINGHGGNVPAMRVAGERVAAADVGLDVYSFSYWDAMYAELSARDPSADPPRIGHADAVETSLMMHVAPDLVRLEAAVPDGMTDGLPSWMHDGRGFTHRTEHGGVGDPTGASPQLGRELFDAAVVGSLRAIDQISGGTNGE